MDRTLYALLVGIDQYPSPVRPLNGCVNDIQCIEELLKLRVGANGFVFRPAVLTNERATRQAVIGGFQTHLMQARDQDIALFYFSGHGSQEHAPPEFWHLEPDKLNETLVCYDSRTEGQYDLADKELAKLLADIAARGPHVVVVLDSCHSGSGTRNGDVVGVRRVPTDYRLRPLDTYLVDVDQARVVQHEPDSAAAVSDWFVLPEGGHIVFSACRADEEAKEYALAGKTRGVFSYFLEQALQRSGQHHTYRDLFNHVYAQVRNRAALQSPQIESSTADMLDQPFLGGAIVAHDQYFTLRYNQNAASWEIDGGRVHGLPDIVDEETTTLAIYASGSTLEEMRNPAHTLATAAVTQVFPERSLVDLRWRNGEPSMQETYRALIMGVPLPPLDVHLRGDEGMLGRVRETLKTRQPRLVQEVAAGAYELHAGDGVYRILRPADSRQLVADITGPAAAQVARNVVAQLEHIARWTNVLDLANPHTAIDNAIEVELHEVNGLFGASGADVVQSAPMQGGAAVRLSYYVADRKQQQPSFKIKLTNISDRSLHCALVNLTPFFGIEPGMLPGGSIQLEPGQETWANGGKPIYAEVPKKRWQNGMTEVRDVLKVIVSTAAFDARLLKQADLESPVLRAAGRVPGTLTGRSALNRLLDRVQLRDLSQVPEDTDERGDWATMALTFTTLRPQESIPIPAEGMAETVGHGVTLRGHPTLKANARLATVPQASREVGTLALPALLRDDPAVARPLEFTASRGGEPGLSVLELFNVGDHTVVRPDQPLRVQLDLSLGDEEHVLPIGFDGEFWLPLGWCRGEGGRTEVVIERLPKPENTQSLASSVRILFHKIVRERLGLPERHPLLSVLEVKAAGQVTYRTAIPDEVAQHVRAANRIVLYIHGLIGNTRGMASGAQGPESLNEPPRQLLADAYDLILTFDYGTVGTRIEGTARLLKERLTQVGLGPGHSKTLHIVAHSIGGLVARWLIEQQDGRSMVQHLVMLGTPNAGSPWPTLQSWATIALGIGLNGFGVGTWPAMALGGLMSAIEKVDVTLDQMVPGSSLLKTLADSPDPGIPYSIIAGDTRQIWHRELDANMGRLGRLLDRLTVGKALHMITATAFFGASNDIAVSVESITHLPKGWAQKPDHVIVSCDYMTYFSTYISLRALADVLK